MRDVVDTFAGVDYALDAAYQNNFTSWTWAGSNLSLVFADGSTKTYSGVTRDPAALKGSVTATGYEFHQEGQVALTHTGSLQVNYELVPSGSSYNLLLSNSSPSTANVMRMATLLPASSPMYEATVGNVTATLAGSVTFDPSNKFSGTFSKIAVTTEKLVSSIVVDGNFITSGNAEAIANGLATSSTSGSMTGYAEDYRDGSYTHVSDIVSALSGTEAIDFRLLADGSRFGGDDVISLDLPGTMYEDFLMASGGGNDAITVKGGGGRMNVDAGSGNDRISILSDAHRIDGAAGLDTVAMALARSNYTVQKTATGFVVTDSLGVTNTLANVERLDFSDAHLAFDAAGTAGQVYRTYQAAFNRAPEADGLGFWMHFMDQGMSLPQVAAGFMAAAEFKEMYGANPGHLDFVNKLYMNVLHRPGEADGIKFYVDALDNPAISYANVLAFFAESPENQAALVGVLSNGVTYTPFGG
jgi:hypothetical protein